MKKPKILIASLAASVMIMGSGYAYWTQDLEIDNTVSTGYLDVKFVQASVGDYDNRGVSDLVTVDKSIAEDGQSMTFTVGNLYPGAGAALNFVVENTGTVNAKVSGVTGTVIENAALANALDYTVDTVKVWRLGHWEILRYIEPVSADSVEELAAKLSNSGIDDVVLQPGERLMLTRTNSPGYDVQMPADITGSQFENETCKFKLGINFTQVN